MIIPSALLVWFIGLGTIGNMMGNADAQETGFLNRGDQQAAIEAGYSDAEAWSARKAEIAAGEAAQKRADEQEAARLAEEAERLATEAAEKEEAERIEQERVAKEREAAEKRLAEAKVAEEKRKGFQCFSAWGGSHPGFKRSVKDLMRDPDSFEEIETRIAPVYAEGYHSLIMTYRARNGFADMNVSEALGLVRNSDCMATVVSVE